MRQAREHLKLSQQELADKIGVSKRGIQDNETRNRVPGGEVINGFVGLGINANWLLTGEGPMLLADLVQTRPVSQRINVDALEAIIEGTIKAAPNSSPASIANHSVQFYMQMIEQGMITPDGIGDGDLSTAA